MDENPFASLLATQQLPLWNPVEVYLNSIADDSRLFDLLVENEFPAPDLIIDPIPLDNVNEDPEVSSLNDLSESRENGQYLSGVYLWYDIGFKNGPLTILNIGKAARLKNRLTTHVNRGSWLDRYWDDVFAQDAFEDDVLVGCPMVAIWFTENRASLEARMQRELNPVYNQRTE